MLVKTVKHNTACVRTVVQSKFVISKLVTSKEQQMNPTQNHNSQFKLKRDPIYFKSALIACVHRFKV